MEKKVFQKRKRANLQIALKEPGFNFGIGRELYTAPFIWIPAEKVKLYDTQRKDKFGKPVFSTKDTFKVEIIKIQNKEITTLSIVNNRNERVFTYKSKNYKEGE